MTDAAKPTLVKDMMRGIRWRLTENGVAAHMIDAVNEPYCGVTSLDWDSVVEDDAVVCKRCLKATEKYA